MPGNNRNCCGQVPAAGYQKALPDDWRRREKKAEKEPVKEQAKEPAAEPKKQEKKDNPKPFPDWEEK